MSEQMSFKDAKKYFRTYIDCEMRDPNGLDETAKTMLAYVKALTRIEQESAWRPIETAPKDVKFIGYNGRVVRRDVMWAEKRNDFDVNGWSCHSRGYTHWYPQEPLPKPPAQGGE